MTAVSARPERSYLAGIGASGALIAAATVAAIFLAALVAFNGWPSAGGQDTTTAAASRAIPAARAASAALAPAAGAVAATPAPVTLASADNPNSIVTGNGVGGGNSGGGTAGNGVGGAGGATVANPGATATATGSGPVGNVVTGLGLDNGLTTPLAQTVDAVGSGLTQVLQSTPQILQQAVPGTLNTVGTTVDTLGQTVNGLLGTPQGQPVPPTP
jgi:hypothetical protein